MIIKVLISFLALSFCACAPDKDEKKQNSSEEASESGGQNGDDAKASPEMTGTQTGDGTHGDKPEAPAKTFICRKSVIATSDGETSKEGLFKAAVAWDHLEAQKFLSAQVTLSLPQDNNASKTISSVELEPRMDCCHTLAYVAKQTIVLSDKDCTLEVKDVLFQRSGKWNLEITALVDGVKDVVKVPVVIP